MQKERKTFNKKEKKNSKVKRKNSLSENKRNNFNMKYHTILVILLLQPRGKRVHSVIANSEK